MCASVIQIVRKKRNIKFAHCEPCLDLFINSYISVIKSVLLVYF